MMKKYFILCYLIIVIFPACKKEEYVPLTGELIGFVTLYDFHNQELSDHSNVTVTIDDGVTQRSAQTDESGKYSIPNIQTGTYDLIFNKEGFATYKRVSYEFVGGNKPTSLLASLYQVPQVDIFNLSFQIYSSTTYDYYSINVSANTNTWEDYEPFETIYYRYYYSTSPEVSLSNYLYTGYSSQNLNRDLSFLFPIEKELFPSGTTIYFIIYPCTETYQRYFDITLGTYIYTSINIEKAASSSFTLS